MRWVSVCQAGLATSKFQPSELTLERNQSIRRLGTGLPIGKKCPKNRSKFFGDLELFSNYEKWGGVERGERDMVRSSPQSGHESFFLSIETMELLLLVPQWNYSMGQTLRRNYSTGNSQSLASNPMEDKWNGGQGGKGGRVSVCLWNPPRLVSKYGAKSKHVHQRWLQT